MPSTPSASVSHREDHAPAPTVSVVIVSYNTRAMTLDCLASVFAETKVPVEVIVVDNNSPDGSATAIAEAFPQVRLFAETENHWFAGGCNLGAAHARGEYVLHLNPDTLVLDGAIDALVDFARETPRARIWGGRTFDGEMRPDPASAWGRMTLWRLFCRASGLTAIGRGTTLLNGEAYGGWDRTGAREVDIVSGCFLLMRRADWEAMGGFDPTFLMYGEEADLCLRARGAIGARPKITPDARIVHYGGASDTVRADKMVRLLKAKAELIKRHFPAWQRGAGLALHAAWPLSRWLVTGLARRGSAPVWREVWTRRAEWREGF
jgi:GT2 family glycosyltransferase